MTLFPRLHSTLMMPSRRPRNRHTSGKRSLPGTGKPLDQSSESQAKNGIGAHDTRSSSNDIHDMILLITSSPLSPGRALWIFPTLTHSIQFQSNFDFFRLPKHHPIYLEQSSLRLCLTNRLSANSVPQASPQRMKPNNRSGRTCVSA